MWIVKPSNLVEFDFCAWRKKIRVTIRLHLYQLYCNTIVSAIAYTWWITESTVIYRFNSDNIDCRSRSLKRDGEICLRVTRSRNALVFFLLILSTTPSPSACTLRMALAMYQARWGQDFLPFGQIDTIKAEQSKKSCAHRRSGKRCASRFPNFHLHFFWVMCLNRDRTLEL